MKKSTATMALLLAMMATGTAALAVENQEYIPWTFDDFDSNCDVVATAAPQPAELSALAINAVEDTEAGELGW